MANISCSSGCFICDQRGDNSKPHSSGCCGSKQCDSMGWNKQVEKWLAAEKRWKAQQDKKQDKLVVRWLLAEQLYLEEQRQAEIAAVAAEREQQQASEQDIAAWLAAEQQFRSTLRLKQPKRVNVEREANSPTLARERAKAAALHG